MEQQVVYRTREMQDLEAAWGEPMGDILRRLYLEDGLTVEQVGLRLGKSKGAISRWLERFGIPTRGHGYRGAA
jgi:DNA-binding transcriptional ArsR family regulator